MSLRRLIVPLLATAGLIATTLVGSQPAQAIAADDGVLLYTPGSAPDGFWSDLHGSIPLAIGGTYTPIVGNFIGSYTDDVFWYGKGSLPDSLWEMNADGTHTTHTMSVGGNYTPVAGNFSETEDASADYTDDIFWYNPGTGADALWDFENDGSITKTSGTWINGTSYKPVVGRFRAKEGPNADFSDDILWLSTTGGSSSLWDFNRDGTISKTVWGFGAPATPLVVNTGDTQDRLFLYRPGTGTDQLIDLMTSNFKTYTINGTYTPVVAYFGFGLGKSILWYAPGSAPDPQWDWNGSTFVNTTTRSVNGTYTPVVGRFSNTGTYVESILWVSLTGGSSPLWTMNGSVTSRNVTLPAGGTPLVIYGIN